MKKKFLVGKSLGKVNFSTNTFFHHKKLSNLKLFSSKLFFSKKKCMIKIGRSEMLGAKLFGKKNVLIKEKNVEQKFF